MPVSNSVSLNNNNNERESSLCTNPVENSSREKPGQFPDFTETREHWSFFSISGWLTGNSSNSLSKGIFRKQRKAECSLLLNRVATLANYYRSVRNEKREGVQRGPAFQRNLANSISHFPWRHGTTMKFLLSSIERIPLPILYASFFKTCVCV